MKTFSRTLMAIGALGLFSVLAIVSLPDSLQGCGDRGALSLETLMHNAVAGDRAAETSLRELGPSALQALLQKHKGSIQQVKAKPGNTPDTWSAVSKVIDRVAGQTDAAFSGLYWYTDMELAKQQAATSKRPILSLRLLGNLDDEFC